ncbi:hypothetical protein BH09BAC5_BH09BAC5_23160 [soil metagenome]
MKNIIQFCFILLLFLTGAGCNGGDKSKKTDLGDRSGDSDYYTCSMHPTVRSQVPGNCPICKMKLIKVKANKKNLAPNQLLITEDKQLLAGISTEEAIFSEINPILTATGKAAVDENNITEIASKINGRIDKLYFRNPNDKVQSGQALYDLYSEELLATENDFLLALKQETQSSDHKDTYTNIVKASRNKMILWGITESQLNELEKNKNVSSRITIYSQVSGYVTAIMVNEGQYVAEGTTLFKVTDLSSIWVVAQLYPEEIQYLNKRNAVNLEFEAYPNEIFSGRVVFDNPTLENNTKINLVRFVIANPFDKIKPGMMAYVSIPKENKKALVIPKSAVLPGVMSTVWVQIDKNTFENRMVITGLENRNEVEIISGIKEGEKVVVSGAYLINSEYIFKKGVDPMGGMKM